MMTVSLPINVHWSPGGALLWRIFAIFTVLALLVFGWRTYKMAKDAFDKFEQLYTDVAVLEAAFGSCRIKTKP
jgi:multisubunit Na+/H+ antiporter MnhB subunit